MPQGLKQAQDPPGAEPGLTFRAGRQRSMERRQARSWLVSQPPEMSLLLRQEMQQRCKQGEAPPSAAPVEKWESSSHRAPQGPKNLTPQKMQCTGWGRCHGNAPTAQETPQIHLKTSGDTSRQGLHLSQLCFAMWVHQKEKGTRTWTLQREPQQAPVTTAALNQGQGEIPGGTGILL